MKFLLSIIISIFILSCSSKEASLKNSNSNKKKKIEKTIKKALPKLETTDDFKGKIYTYHDLTIEIPDNFKEKDKGIFFEEEGTNLQIKRALIKGDLKEYIDKNFKKLKSDYSETIKEEKDYEINGKNAKSVKYIIDRKKYLIQIESLLITNDGITYIINISGKKNHMDNMKKTVLNIFSTVKFNKVKNEYKNNKKNNPENP